MMQRINLLQNNRSIFKTVVAFIVPETGPIHLVLVCLTASKLAGQQADENLIVKKLPVIIQLLMRFSDI